MGVVFVNTILSLVLSVINHSLNHDVNYDISMAILNQYHQFDQLTLSSLATQCNTSPNAIKRYCEMLGCKSFTDFKSLLKMTCNIRKKQISFRVKKTNEDQIMASLKNNALTSFDEMKFRNDIEALADLIHRSNKVIFLGACFPSALTINFQEDLITMGKIAYSYPINESFQGIVDATDALIIAVSISGSILQSIQKPLENSKNDIVMIGGINVKGNRDYYKIKVDLPLDEDDETGNIFILETLRYLRNVYFNKYIQKF